MKTLDSNLQQFSGLGQRALLRRFYQLGLQGLHLFFRTYALPAFFVLAPAAQAAPVTITWSGWVTNTSAGFGAIGSEVIQTLTYDTGSPNLNPWYNPSNPSVGFPQYAGMSYSIQSGATTITNGGTFLIWNGWNGSMGPAADAIYLEQNNGSVSSGNVLLNGVATTHGMRNRLWDSSYTLLESHALPTSLPALPGLLANIPAGSNFSGDLWTTGQQTLLLEWDSAAPQINSPVPDHTGVGSLIVALIGVVGVARFKRISARP
jgi:hypothetical protein